MRLAPGHIDRGKNFAEKLLLFIGS